MTAFDVLLCDETDHVEGEEIERRQILAERIVSQIPREALERLQILQPTVGCLNSCSFCSQLAAPVTRCLDRQSLRTIMGALRGAMRSQGISAIGSKRSHKPTVVFPYLDNDIGSYPSLVDYLIGVDSLGGKTRISTVGWSRHNLVLQHMHEEIAANHLHRIDGIRYSLTPYALGWKKARSEYISDLLNAIKTYEQFRMLRGTSRRRFCIELRFPPHIQLAQVTTYSLGEFHVISCGEYNLVTRNSLLLSGLPTYIKDVHAQRVLLTQPGHTAIQLIGQGKLDSHLLKNLFEKSLPYSTQLITDDFIVTKGLAYKFHNIDGEYFCFSPFLTDNRQFQAIQYYPQTESRHVSGLLDSSRPLLNTITKYKLSQDVDPGEAFEAASLSDIDSVLASLRAHEKEVKRYSLERSLHITQNVLPLVEALVQCFRTGLLEPSLFFDPRFLIDTGTIVNQGRAIHEFKGLISKQDSPLTPNEEKGYGITSQSSVRGNTWRFSPIPVVVENGQSFKHGAKSQPFLQEVGSNTLALGVFEWNPQVFANKSPLGSNLRSFLVPIGDLVNPLVVETLRDGLLNNAIPGAF